MQTIRKKPMTFSHLKKLEGLLHSLTQARDRKRRGLTLHADELPDLIEALGKAIALVDLHVAESLANTKEPEE